MSRRSVILGLTAGLLVMFSAAADNVIVSSKLHPITDRMIACPPTIRSIKERCLAIEQTRLDSFVVQDWVRAAAQLYGVALSADEQSFVEHRVAERHDATVRAAKHFRQIDEFVLRIRRGENRDQVTVAAIQAGITPADLEGQLALLPSIKEAERAVARDPAADADAAIRRNATQKIIIRHLESLVRVRSKQQHLSFEAAEQQLWDAAIAKIEMRVVDPRYHLPARKGVFKVREQTVTIHP